MKIRIKYAKTGVMKFLGHLDVMRFYQKALRRAKFDVMYSQGYSPHQLITFAAPLGLGITSEGEYFDAEMNTITSSAQMVEQLNQAMVPGMKIQDIVLLEDNAKTAMSIVAASDYIISIREEYPQYQIEQFKKAVTAFYQQPCIMARKITKKKDEVVDIKPFIYDIKASEQGVYMFLSTGSIQNIKPELVMEAMCEYLKIEYNKYAFAVHRIETYMRDKQEQLVSLLCAGSRIE